MINRSNSLFFSKTWGLSMRKQNEYIFWDQKFEWNGYENLREGGKTQTRDARPERVRTSGPPNLRIDWHRRREQALEPICAKHPNSSSWALYNGDCTEAPSFRPTLSISTFHIYWLKLKVPTENLLLWNRHTVLEPGYKWLQSHTHDFILPPRKMSRVTLSPYLSERAEPVHMHQKPAANR